MKHKASLLPIGVVLLAVAALVTGSLACELAPKPLQITFTSDHTNLVPGECTTLRWHVPDEYDVALNGQSINPSGQMDVCPTETTTYQLRVGSGENAVQQEITIVVEEAGSPSVTVTPTTSAPPPSATHTPTVTPSNTPTPTRTPTVPPPPPPPPPPTQTPTVPPPPPPPPPLTFTFSPTSGPAGSDVDLHLSAAVQAVVYYEGRVLPKRVLDGGLTLRVTIPGDASTGYFELQWDGQSARASAPFVVAAANATVTLVNNTGQSVWYVYISPSDQATWGEDRLGSSVIPSGSSFVFTVPPGTYDLKAEDSSHNVMDTRWSVNLSGPYSWNIGP